MVAMVNLDQKIYILKQLGWSAKMQEENPLILIYFSGRGKLQPVRNMVSYLGCSYFQVHLDKDQTKRQLPEHVKTSLKGVKIDKNALPLLIHKGHAVSDTFPIISYLARNYDPALLGKSLRQRARVNQLTQCVILKQQAVMLDILNLAESCAGKGNEQILKGKLVLFQKIMNESCFVKEMCQYLQRQDKQETYVLEDLTIIDFYFMEMCVKMLGFFRDLQEKKFSATEINFKSLLNCEQGLRLSENTKYIATMAKYLEFIRSQPFYAQNQKYLEQFSLICPSFTQQTIQGIRKIWADDPVYIK